MDGGCPGDCNLSNPHSLAWVGLLVSKPRVAALQRLGETPEEIMNTLRLDAERLTVPKILQLPSLNYMQVRIQTLVLRQLLAFLLALLKEGIKDHPSSSPQNLNSVQEAHIINSNSPNSAVKDMQADETTILETNRHMWRPSSLVHPLSYPSKDKYMNKSFQGMHVNLPPQMNQQIYSRQLQNGQPMNLPHSALHLSLQNRIGNPIPKPEHHDFQFRNGQPALPNYPVPMEGRMFMPQDTKNINGPIRPSASNRYGFNPYPYYPSISHNSSVYGAQISPGQSIEKNLSDEMKRQLRDGKVVLLSDSVVRSNFTQEKEEADEGASVGKNETQKQP